MRVQPTLRVSALPKGSPCNHRYYDRIFPANLMVRWLGYGSQHAENATDKLIHRREFSFTTGDDIYIRYLSYEDAAAFKKVSAVEPRLRSRLSTCDVARRAHRVAAVGPRRSHCSPRARSCLQDLVAKLPHKIDIGAIFSAAPRDHKKFKVFEPQQREFIIDIDLTDCELPPRPTTPPIYPQPARNSTGP